MKEIIFNLGLIILLVFLGCSASSQGGGFDTLITGGGVYDVHIRDNTGTIHENGEPGVLSIENSKVTGKRGGRA
jgi:hypothetical protein